MTIGGKVIEGGMLWVPDHAEVAKRYQNANRVIDLTDYQVVVPVLIGMTHAQARGSTNR